MLLCFQKLSPLVLLRMDATPQHDLNVEEETKVLEKLKSIRMNEWNNVPIELLEKEQEQGLIEYIHVSHSDDKYIGFVEHLYTNKDKSLENEIESIEFDEKKYPKVLPKEIEVDQKIKVIKIFIF